jgi:hypothetical protein
MIWKIISIPVLLISVLSLAMAVRMWFQRRELGEDGKAWVSLGFTGCTSAAFGLWLLGAFG